MFHTVIVDDDPNSVNAAKEALKPHADIDVIAAFQNSPDFFSFAEHHAVDLVFLDIELERETGFDIAEKISKKYPDICIIFLTGHASYAIDSYDFQPLFFLTKPISNDKLKKALDVFRSKNKAGSFRTNAKLMFKCHNSYKMLEVSKIDYIERRARKNIVVCGKEEFKIAYYTMTELMEMVGKYGFFMCHQSYIVALSKIDEIFDERKQLYAIRIKKSGKIIPVSRNHYEELRKLTQRVTEEQI
ncbi:MAG: LytTR family DNA-binding domain-containing protein [Lachnospiraceae bacterium]|nr:LytTR family DNA-binding domain-containing protein [Lachnospiraceae bacterium]